MKKILSILVMTLCFVGLWSCGDDDNETKIDIKLHSSSITEGEEVDARFTPFVTLKYNVAVTLSNKSSITLNGQALKPSPAASPSMEIEIPLSLEPGTAYTLNVPAGAVVSSVSSVKGSAPAFTLHFSTKQATKEPDFSDEPNVAIRMARLMGWGWNLGNHFDTGANTDANGNPIDFQEPKWGYWDGAKPTQQLYVNLAKMGVKTVRMPVTWGNHQYNDGAYTIKSDYMAEVEQNVQWALDAGMYVVLNTHHDEYWQDIVNAVKDSKLNATIEDRLTKTWTQIAQHFESYSDHLIFETMNEVHDESWGWKGGFNYTSIYALMNQWNKVCVDAIRATGGNNAERWIGIPGFCASPTFTLKALTIPNNDKRIMVAVHCYDPFDFCTKGTIQQWGHKFKGNDSDEKQIRDMFQNLYNKYVANEIPCYMGEYGVETRSKTEYEKYRSYYLEYFCRCAYIYGIAPMLWDNNSNSNDEKFYYINHNDGTCHTPTLVNLMVKATTSADANYTLQSIYDNAK